MSKEILRPQAKPAPAAQPEQEPVAWMDVDGNVSDNNDHNCFPIPLYTASNIKSYLEKDNLQPEQEPINDGWQITFANGHSGFGVYAHMDEYPEEGSRLLCAVPQWAKDALKATTPPLCPTCEALARTVMMDQTGKDT